MTDTGQGRKASDRRRVRANRVVDTAHTGAAPKIRNFRISRTAAFVSGSQSGRNGRA